MNLPDVPREWLTTARAALLRMVYGGQTAQVIYVATKLDIADVLARGPGSSSEIAAAVSVDEPTLRRLLRGLVSLGLCAEVAVCHFALTDVGKYLRSDQPDSLHARIL